MKTVLTIFIKNYWDSSFADNISLAVSIKANKGRKKGIFPKIPVNKRRNRQKVYFLLAAKNHLNIKKVRGWIR